MPDVIMKTPLHVRLYGLASRILFSVGKKFIPLDHTAISPKHASTLLKNEHGSLTLSNVLVLKKYFTCSFYIIFQSLQPHSYFTNGRIKYKQICCGYTFMKRVWLIDSTMHSFWKDLSSTRFHLCNHTVISFCYDYQKEMKKRKG